MVNVAIAGGTGGVGKTIVEVMQASPHQAFILSRQLTSPKQSSTSPDNTIAVDYNSIEEVASRLEKHNIHTVISAFAVEGDSLAVSQRNLIQAADRSKTTKRFIPSGYAIPYPAAAVEVLPPLKDHFLALDELRESGLEWTLFNNGIFLDYFGPSTMKSNLKPNVFVIDVANKVAAIPGDGNSPVTFTYTYDLARFIVAALDLEKWEEESRVVGDELTWNQFVALAEACRGSKFDVYYDDVEKLKRFEITELPGHQALYEHFPKKPFQWFMSIFELFTTDGSSHVQRAGSLNHQFPHIKVLSVKEMFDLYWGQTETDKGY
ncbi:NAD(P)-binding protein [Aspergillus steynii IBT 23096]|uniref:NAD(P)-binding protein n=1 Tax=Aspergillus steynii IBT 23096 TaxID=1392250 RepID=A0A2I2G7Q5_9EURO|nr:NAD(P)-binding protein [Aspergillus steynii IBT 23096]PLB48916.1 NAD(P)-binding protein [Aspergillus steynii IBT 23096]